MGPARLEPGQLCAACEAQAAWSTLGPELVIDRAAIAAAIRRREGEAAGEPVLRRLSAWASPVATLGLAAMAVWLTAQLGAARPIGPLRALLDDLHAATRWCALGGLGTLVAGAVALVRARRKRQYRRLAIVTSPLLAIVAGGIALGFGGLHLAAGAGEVAWRYTAMPAREPLGVASYLERIVNATAVVLAPDADGDARELAIGTGAVVAGDASRAWIVTCSHVAMPYAAVGAWRRARDAQPVWVQLADGREGKATVRWAAAPPLDVVLVELPIANPPEPVEIASDTTDLQVAARVSFVPHPYRAGWKVLDGELRRRETHHTPAGTYDLLYTDLPVTHGDSGSGLYDARGRLVGLNTWTRAGDGGAQGISLPSETLRGLVAAIRANRFDELDEAVRPAPRK